jgi:hypothetical protein
VTSRWRKRTKVQTMAMLTAIARSLVTSEESMAMPCSGEDIGRVFAVLTRFKIATCDVN